MKNFIKYYFYTTGILFLVIMLAYTYLNFTFIKSSVNTFLPTLIILFIISISIANIYIAFHLDKLIKNFSKLLIVVPAIYMIFAVCVTYINPSIINIIFTLIHICVLYVLFNSVTKKVKRVSRKRKTLDI